MARVAAGRYINVMEQWRRIPAAFSVLAMQEARSQSWLCERCDTDGPQAALRPVWPET